MVAESITELSMSSKWEERRWQAPIHKASLYPHRSLFRVCSSRFLYGLMATGRLGWSIGRHCLSPWSGLLYPRETLCLVLSTSPPQNHYFPSLRHTGTFLFLLRHEPCFSDFGPKSRSQRVTYKFCLMLYSLSPSSRNPWSWKGLGFPLPLSQSELCYCRVDTKTLAPHVENKAKRIWRNSFLYWNLFCFLFFKISVLLVRIFFLWSCDST